MEPCRVAVGSTELEIILSCEQIEPELETLTICPILIRPGKVGF